MVFEDAATARAERLLQDVLGETRFRQLDEAGSLDLPSRLVPGRTYRLDRDGNLLYRDPGESAFRTTLCVQPEEAIPRDDAVAMRYLLITADEERLVQVANPISFGFLSLARALHHDFGQRFHPAVSVGFTAALMIFFVGCFLAEGWFLFHLLPRDPVLAVLLLLFFLAPALIGGTLLAALVFDLWHGLGALRHSVCRPEVGRN